VQWSWLSLRQGLGWGVRLGLPPEKDVVCWAGGGTSYFKERKEKTRGVYGGDCSYLVTQYVYRRRGRDAV